MNHPNQKNFHFGIAQSAYTLTNKDEIVADNLSKKKRTEISTTDRSSKYLQNMILCKHFNIANVLILNDLIINTNLVFILYK